uniref:Uncharacterized protein n=1 Tax=Scophthalmus maximus TaxID=52904 RepID=A0A8D3A4V4_SCOMX
THHEDLSANLLSGDFVMSSLKKVTSGLKNKNKHTKANSNAITNQTEYEHRTQFTQSHLQSIIYTCTSITRFSPYMVCTTLPKKQGFFKQQTVHH